MTQISETDLITFFKALKDQPLEFEAGTVDHPFYEPYLEGDNDPIKELERNITWSDQESITLLSGSRGNGKSTELRRLRGLLQQQNYTVFLCDMEGYLNEHAPVEITDFLFSIILALNEQMKSEYGKDFIAKNFLGRVVEFLQSEVKLDELGIEGLIKGKLIKDYDFKQRLQDDLRNRVERVIEEIRDFVADITQFIKNRDQNQLVLIVDSVEKLRGIGTDAQAVHESVENLFKHHGDRLRLDNWHLVYTVPPYVTSLRLGDGNICQLPNVHVFNRDRQPDTSGITTMRNIIQRRFDKWEAIFSTTQLEQMILATGGDFRGFFRLIKSVLRKIPLKNKLAKIPVADLLITQAKSDALNDLLPIPNDEMAWLCQIAKSRQAELPARDDLPVFIGFLDNNFILTYRNGEDWYDVHPLLREMLKC